MFHVDKCALLLGATALLTTAAADADRPGETLTSLIRGNERLGRHLLQRLHHVTPERNVVVSPLSVSIVLAALQSGSDYDIRREIREAVGWPSEADLQVAARTLLGAFEKPELIRIEGPRIGPQGHLVELPEAAWISNAVLYRGSSTLSEGFVNSATKYFGMTFASTGEARPTPDDIRTARPDASALPERSEENDVLISSGTHLRTAWNGNTFSLSEPFRAEFHIASGDRKIVEMLTSELATYWYARTETFEAAVLPCNRAYMLIVLPAPGKDIRALERELADVPDAVDAALIQRIGRVTLPPFDIQSESRLRSHLEDMGVRRVFTDLGELVRIQQSFITEINQRVTLAVDKLGIRADAETVGGAIYGGIMGGVMADPFHMRLDRPFVFFVRDSTTNALLFAGAVIDPES